MNVDEMEAGRELDAAVALNVMEWRASVYSNYPWQLGPPGGKFGEVQMCPHYSTDIAAAWEVAEKLSRRGLVQVNLWHNRKVQCWVGIDYVVADTVPLAICRIALEVMLNGEE